MGMWIQDNHGFHTSPILKEISLNFAPPLQLTWPTPYAKDKACHLKKSQIVRSSRVSKHKFFDSGEQGRDIWGRKITPTTLPLRVRDSCKVFAMPNESFHCNVCTAGNTTICRICLAGWHTRPPQVPDGSIGISKSVHFTLILRHYVSHVWRIL